MTTRVFFLNKLHPGAEVRDYERWVSEVDYPTARSLPSVVSYDVVRIDGTLFGTPSAPCAYLELIEVTDLADYEKDVASFPDRERFLEQLGSYVGDAAVLHGSLLR